MIYLDNAATTYPKPEVVYKTLDKAQREYAFNAGRGHYPSADQAEKIITKTRTYLCNICNADKLIFTNSATQALNQIIAGLNFQANDIVYCSPYDHNAIVRTLYAYSKKIGFTLKVIPLKEDLTIDIEKLDFQFMKDKPRAVFCTHVSNVTGYILPIESIGMICDKYDSTYIVDGAQAFGLLDFDFKKCNIDYYVFAGHKTLYGPFGIAGYFCKILQLELTVFGGTGTDSLNLNMPQEGFIRYEPSSPNVVAIAGLLEAAKWVKETNVLDYEKELQLYALNKLNDIDDLIVYSFKDISQSVGIISINLESYDSNDLSKILSEDFDICVRGGYHCCPFLYEYLDIKRFNGTVRISLSYFNTKEDIDKLVAALEELSYES